MGFGYKELAIKVLLSQENEPLKVSEIWEIAEKKGYYKQLDNISQDPGKSLWVALDQSVGNEEGIFICSGSPKKYRVSTKYSREYEKEKREESSLREVEKGEDRVRKPIPKHIREAVWRRYWGNKKDGKCWICERVIGDDIFECGHIIASSKGGGDDVLNLVPICGACNKGMGTENLLDHKKRYWSHINVFTDTGVQPEGWIAGVETVPPPSIIKPEQSEKTDEIKKKMSSKVLINMLKDLPNYLGYTLEVYYYTLDGLTRNDATNMVANRKGITPSTVVSSYTRQLGMSASEIDTIMQPGNEKKFKKTLIVQFPEYIDKINEFFNNIR